MHAAPDAPVHSPPPPPVPGELEGPGLLENSATNLVGMVVGNGLSALAGLLTARVLGPAGVGILAVVFGIVEFGRALSNFTHNPSILEAHRGKEEGVVYGTSLALKLAGSTAFVLVVFAASGFLASLFDVPATALVLTSTLLVIGSVFEVGAARLEADNRNLLRVSILAMGPIVGLAGIVLFIASGTLSVHTAIATSLLGTAAMSLGFVVLWDGPRRLRYDPATAGYYLRYGSRLVASSFLTMALLWTDTLMVSALLGNEATGVYNVVFQLTFVMVTASVAIGVALLPAMSRRAGRGEDTHATYHRGTLVSGALALLLALLFALGSRFFLSLYGPGFEEGLVPLFILLLFGIAAALQVPAASLLTVHGHAGLLTAVGAVQVAANVALNWVLIHAFGIVGAALATTTIFTLGTLATWALAYKTTGALPLTRETIREGWRAIRDPRRARRF